MKERAGDAGQTSPARCFQRPYVAESLTGERQFGLCLFDGTQCGRLAKLLLVRSFDILGWYPAAVSALVH